MSSPMHDRVLREVEGLHEFFVGWFNGTIPESAFASGFLSRFSEDFILIPPAGTLLGLADIASSIRSAYATNPKFRIRIRRVQVQRELDGHVLSTYEEWQRNALASTPSDNGRLTTVLFSSTEPLQWLHVHETWLPRDIMSEGPYDF